MFPSADTIPPSSSSYPVIQRRPRSRSFGAGTPTFSSDLAKLKAACSSHDHNDNGSIVHSYSEAITIASSFDVMGSNSPLSRKLTLEGKEDWIEFMNKSGAVSSSGGDEDGNPTISIHLEKFLRYCFDFAYKMPSSPKNRNKTYGVDGGVASVSPLPLQV
eukprot:CAMPEP_0196132968 /NCGR_PEP_ID=MMETSP0910-20130528/2384_1 /TAXON_ID=49265 /ORGANISM="Thalassiosira rotula, Strain GSO102" /LENGTH=159 /DNA_ID=CAMNT_0041392637 /DNA_START=85 /DNA_END=564 /DNA_ORIENTATION=+